ncbi:NTPase [Escherichia coli]|nr:NTPase [Escherichia coli]
MYFPLIHYGIIYCDTLLSHPQKHLPKRKLTAGQSFADLAWKQYHVTDTAQHRLHLRRFVNMNQPHADNLQGQHPDRAICSADEDQYGFIHIATQLAVAVKGIGREGSAVIGIEGPWGSGKTSLLNLLRNALVEQIEERTFVLTISPWLDGSNTSLVASLLLPVANIIAAEEEQRLAPEERTALRRRKSLTRTAKTMIDYTRATARNLAPVASAAAVIPGVPDASGALKALSETRWLKEKEKTTAEMRTEIAKKIDELDLSFIVLLDDLDRLEPAQAVEVIRLVKSVGDFPRFRYLLCYDKAILSQAISLGLGVPDGNLYLQKIVQISFCLPRPETFVLRRKFRDAAAALYRKVNGHAPDRIVLEQLTQVADVYGAALKTPREVQMVLNALTFLYPGMRDYVYFPDLCFLQLLRTTNAGLYDWVEEYLSERAVVAAGDGHVSELEQAEMAESLKSHLARYFPAEAHAVHALARWVPGITGWKTDSPIKLFVPTPEQDSALLTAGKRLGSQAYWRYYFAFSAPQNVLSPEMLNEIFDIAGYPEQQHKLAERLLGYIQSKGLSSRTWFEHILTQLTTQQIATRTPEQCRGLAQFFFDSGDKMLQRYQDENDWFSIHDLDTWSVTDRLINKIQKESDQESFDFLPTQFKNGQAWYWIAEYMRHLLWQHGRVGDRAVHEQQKWIPSFQLDSLCETLAHRLNGKVITDQLASFPQLNGYIWAWRDISGVEAVRTWVQEQIRDDEAFLKLLLQLCYHGISSAEGRFTALKLSDLADFFGEPDQIRERIENIRKAGPLAEMAKQVETSIKRNRF